MPSSPATPTIARINPLKLRPPVAGSGIERDRIVALIERTSANLVLVTATAGYGKSTAMGQLYRHKSERGDAVSWLTADRSDNDLGRFAFYLWVALSNALPELGAPPLASEGIESAAAAASVRVHHLVEALALIEAPFVLFIDDFEQVTASDALALVNTLVSGLSPGQTLIVGSRQKPELPLGRLRVQGRLLEIETDSLKFSVAETRSYVASRLDCVLDETELASLQERTDGWPAALQLAAAALAGRSSVGALLQGLAESSRSISDYLAEDVLARLPAAQRSFLIDTSVLETFCPAMCDAVLERTDSHALIAQTERDNLFLQLIDSEGMWYRYHPLFQEFLREQFRRTTDAQRIVVLQLKAARWLAADGKVAQAIPYALAAGDHELAAGMMAQRATDLVRIGQLDTVTRWVAAIPDAVLARWPELMIAGAYAMTYLHRYADANRLVDKLAPATPSSPKIAADLVALRIMLGAWSDHLPEAFRAAESARETLVDADPYAIGLMHNALAFFRIAQGRYLDALHDAAIAKRAMEPIGALHGLNYSVSFEGAIDLLQGNAREARSRFERTLADIIAAGYRYTTSTAVVVAHLAETLYELDELDAAEVLLTDYLPLIREGCLPDHLIVAYRVLARIQAHRGHHGRAIDTLNTLQDLGDLRGLPRIAAAARIDKLRLALLVGDIAAAQRLIARINDESIWQPFGDLRTYANDLDDPEIAAYRLALATGAGQTVIPRLQDAICHADAANRRRRVLRLQCLLAQAFEAARRRPQALETLERALAASQADGLVRVFADEPWHLQPLLTALESRHTAVAPAYLQTLLKAAERPTPRPVPATSNDLAAADNPLSQRESQLLRLLADGNSNKELARKLFVSENTVETHLRRIYGKLGTRNRTQAVARARERGVI
ncbi:MAG TPA: LuxR C-terminal-related transcriptional regulator [Aromatoleum sp.]|uniref:LuxR C-terminal-related transcriptional regulator n=1 Tax=Aromatoleum sp. TaxID=2307007 RepID=UPI002B471F4F|nr:LuxR C-terminal-related transcriptional regulator [Aromatoleum sp.]HJV27704.1 LuxR C-terminal-related transcriptional regulator [Aromatoleum sp.]